MKRLKELLESLDPMNVVTTVIRDFGSFYPSIKENTYKEGVSPEVDDWLSKNYYLNWIKPFSQDIARDLIRNAESFAYSGEQVDSIKDVVELYDLQNDTKMWQLQFCKGLPLTTFGLWQYIPLIEVTPNKYIMILNDSEVVSTGLGKKHIIKDLWRK